jgi:hypothetical protein
MEGSPHTGLVVRQDCMVILMQVEPGDVIELQYVVSPTPDMLRVIKAVLLLLGT